MKYKFIIIAVLLYFLVGFFVVIIRNTNNTSVYQNTQTQQATSSAVTVQEIHTPIQKDTQIVESSGTTKTSADLIKGMTMTFDDEFNSLSLYTDANGNTTCNSGGVGIWQTVYHFCSRTIPTNAEAEIYIDKNFLDYMNKHAATPSNATVPFTVNGGILTIQASPSDTTIQKAAGNWAQYTSGLLTTQFSFSQKYGYFEIRAKLPKGRGIWPAFWLLPVDKSWPPEIDVMEAFGDTNSKNEGGRAEIHYASHTINKTNSCGGWVNINKDITNSFHTYGVDWEADSITYYFDGLPYTVCKGNNDADKPFYMLLNLAVGGKGSWPGTPDSSTTWPAYMYVDYVRVYQRK